jgi:phospholipid/cholesterol/gamma-HCH transport system ATP-binding protein
MQRPTTETSNAIIRLINVHKSFGSLDVLHGVSLEFPTSQTTVVLGPSGGGKSVMLKHIAGLLRPDAGEVWFESSRVDQLSEKMLGPIRRQIGFLFQQSALFDSMSVGENIAFPLEQLTTQSKSEISQRVEEVLSMVGLAHTTQKMPADLSGGQRKRVALARAIVLKPKVILYDEPTTGLDPIRADVINELILKLQQELQVTSIVVTHDLTSAFHIADSLVMLQDGNILLNDTPERFRQSDHPVVKRFLAGEADPDELAGIGGRGERKR